MSLLKKIARLLKGVKYNLGKTTPSRPFPSKISSGAALQLHQESENLSPAARLSIIQELLGGQDVCITCGHKAERPALITEEQARELLGVKK